MFKIFVRLDISLCVFNKTLQKSVGWRSVLLPGRNFVTSVLWAYSVRTLSERNMSVVEGRDEFNVSNSFWTTQ